MTSAPEWLTLSSFHERLTAAGFELNREWLGLIIRKADGPITKPGRMWQGAPTRLVLWPAARTWYVLYTAKRRTLPRPNNVDINAIRKSLGLAPLAAKPIIELPQEAPLAENPIEIPQEAPLAENPIEIPQEAPLAAKPPVETVLEPAVPRKRGRPRKDAAPKMLDRVEVVIPKPVSIKKSIAQAQVEITEFGRLQRCQLGPIVQWFSLGSAGERTLLWPL